MGFLHSPVKLVTEYAGTTQGLRFQVFEDKMAPVLDWDHEDFTSVFLSYSPLAASAQTGGAQTKYGSALEPALRSQEIT